MPTSVSSERFDKTSRSLLKLCMLLLSSEHCHSMSGCLAWSAFTLLSKGSATICTNLRIWVSK